MWSLFFKKSKQLKMLKKGETNKAIIINKLTAENTNTRLIK